MWCHRCWSSGRVWVQGRNEWLYHVPCPDCCEEPEEEGLSVGDFLFKWRREIAAHVVICIVPLVVGLLLEVEWFQILPTVLLGIVCFWIGYFWRGD